MFRTPLVPDDFELPTLSTDAWRLEPLNMKWLVQDYAALVVSWEHLDGLMVPPGTLGPISDLSMEMDVMELGWHEREFVTRRSFAYVAIGHDDAEALGYAYLYASPHADEDAAILTWARWDEADPEADARLYGQIRDWVAAEWPFANAVFPGRSVPWDEWLAKGT